jgi:hypothetical protein
VEIKCQLDATEVFIADLISCSTCFGHHYAHHQELNSIIQWLLPVVFGAVVFKLLFWCGAEGYVSGLQDAPILSNRLSCRSFVLDRVLHVSEAYVSTGLMSTLYINIFVCLEVR